MRVSISLAALAALAASGCGATLWPKYTSPTPGDLATTLNCVAQQAKSLKYKVQLVNHSRGMYAIRRDTLTKGYADEVRRDDILQATIHPTGSGSTLELTAGTQTQQETRRGRTPGTEPASPRVKSDAQQIVTACSANTPPDSTAHTDSTPR